MAHYPDSFIRVFNECDAELFENRFAGRVNKCFPRFKKYFSGKREVPGGGFFFDIEKTDTDGHVNDSANFVNFLMNLRRNTAFTPERRVTPP